MELALGINSAYSENKLTALHPNIKVMRRPWGLAFWAHHEKIVCIDQCSTFIGGLDLCYGRWDDYQHRLSDLGEAEYLIKIRRHPSRMPRKVSSVPEIPTLLASKIDDEIMTSTKKGNEAIETKRFKVVVRKAQALKAFGTLPEPSCAEASNIHRDLQEMALTQLGLERQFHLWHGKDYVNFIARDLRNLDESYTDMINRKEIPRLPWHDVALWIQGPAAHDVARHFILRWNHAKVFHCLPTNSIHSFKELKQYHKEIPLAEKDPERAAKILENIKGYLVEMPFEFLCEENLAPALSTKEHYLPSSIWT